MEEVGALILGFHRNLQEIRASAGGDDDLVRGTIDRAEAALRAQAREFCAAAASVGFGGAGLPAGRPGASSPLRCGPSPPALLSPLPPRARATVPAQPVNFGEGARLPGQRGLRAPARGARHRAKTATAQRMLPRPNRLDPLSDPPALTERDLQGGLLNLAARGFIPPASDLTPAMERGVPVIQQRPAQLYDQATRHARREVALADDFTAVHFDNSPPPPPRMSRSADDIRGGQMGRRSPTGHGYSARALPPISPSATSGRSLPALPAPPLLVATSPAQGGSAIEHFGTFCTELLEAAPDPLQGDYFSGQHVAVPEAPDPELIRHAAVTVIAAYWRGSRQRRHFAQLRTRDTAARRIQGSWAAAMTRIMTKMEVLRIQEEGRRVHTALMEELGQEWFEVKQLKRVEIHICSVTVAESRRGRMDNFQALQASQIGRIFRLLDPKRDVILVAPRPLHEDILDYYAKIMQFRGIRNPPGRFQVVVPENMGLSSTLSLSQGLLCSPKALRRIRRLVSGRPAYIVPEVVTPTELKLCTELRLPLFGAGPRNMALSASKSNAKKLAQLAEVPTGPWAVDIYDEDELFTSLAGLVIRHPHVRTWLFKIDDERDSRGHAYIDLTRMRDISEAVQGHVAEHGQPGADTAGASGETPDLSMGRGGGAFVTQGSAPHVDDDEPAIIGATAEEVRQVLRRLVPRRVCLCNRRAYPDWVAWMAEASRVGAVIQAVPERLVSQTTVHLQIDPDGGVNVLGSSEAVTSQPFVRAASYYPHTSGSWEVLQEAGVRLGHVLATKGHVGFASVDVVFFENPEYDPNRPLELEREPTPLVIGGGTPVDPRHLMFEGLRSPSPPMSADSEERLCGGTPMRPSSIGDGALVNAELALQAKASVPGMAPADDIVSMMLGGGGPSPASRFGCWVVDVDARLTDEAAALFPLQFVGQLRLDPASGLLGLAPGAGAAADGGGGKPLGAQEVGDTAVRWAMVSRVATAPELSKMSHQTLFQFAKMRGVSFDLLHNIGCVFNFLDALHALCSVLAVDRSPDLCAKRLAAAVSALAEGAPRTGAAASSVRSRVSAPREVVQAGREADATDGISVIDVQAALRAAQKRWTDKRRA